MAMEGGAQYGGLPGLRRCYLFFLQAEDAIRDLTVTGVQTCALPIYSGQNTPIDGSVNVKELFVAEPFVVGGDKLYFTLQVAPSTLGMAPPNSQWLIVWNRQGDRKSVV